VIELEASAVVGADRHERSEERTNYRNGNRPRTLTTQVGDLEPLIPSPQGFSEGATPLRELPALDPRAPPEAGSGAPMP
jgi:hypothetical protein